ncbi:hypothetical protein C0995_006718 [Termitomyces sp. Mi166|nr:hypothetical protein C0995_006718 [Termitomyces sp. Mi166\
MSPLSALSRLLEKVSTALAQPTMRFGTLFASLMSLPFLYTVAAPAAPETIGGLGLGTIINLLGIGIVRDINVIITSKNPLPFELTIDRVMSSAGVNGTLFATFDHTFFAPFIVVPLGTANSGTFSNVTLTQGIDALFAIILAGVLDLMKTDMFVRVATIKGKLGFPLQIDGLK